MSCNVFHVGLIFMAAGKTLLGSSSETNIQFILTYTSTDLVGDVAELAALPIGQRAQLRLVSIVKR